MKNIKFEEIKACPICGNVPYIEKASLYRGNGHGYPGYYSFSINCHCCSYLKSEGECTIYQSEQEAQATAIKNWNTEVKNVEKLLAHKLIK